jgi:hypothetical protein
MFEVQLVSFPAAKEERLERVVQKHSGGKLDHLQRLDLLGKVKSGQPQVIARYHEEHCAHNAIAEVTLQGGKAILSGAE